MLDNTNIPRSNKPTSGHPPEGRETSNSRSSNDPTRSDGPEPGAADGPTQGATPAPTPKGRAHPTVISGRVSHSTKGRAKDVARARGISLCQLVREAVQRAVHTHKKSPDAG